MGVIQFLGRGMYLPGKIQNGEMDRTISDFLEGADSIEYEHRKAHGLAMIIIENGGELAHLEMLNDLMIAPNRLHGVTIGKTEILPTNAQRRKDERRRVKPLCAMLLASKSQWIL